MAIRAELARLMGLSNPETMPEAALDEDGVIGLDADPVAPDELEAGIAAVFDAIRNGGGGEAADAVPEADGVTFALLTELNRLWQTPPA